MAKRRFSGVSARSKRLTFWNLGPGMDTIATGDPAQITGNEVTIIGSGISPTIPALTVVRLRGMVQVQLVAADATRAGYQYALGIGITTLDSFTDVGATALPDPFDDADWPGWIWHQFGMINSPFGAVSATNNQHSTNFHEIDSKAMRKFRLSEVMFAIVQAGEIAVALMDVKLACRGLFKLP